MRIGGRLFVLSPKLGAWTCRGLTKFTAVNTPQRGCVYCVSAALSGRAVASAGAGLAHAMLAVGFLKARN